MSIMRVRVEIQVRMKMRVRSTNIVYIVGPVNITQLLCTPKHPSYTSYDYMELYY
jgi:hypothetical protein